MRGNRDLRHAFLRAVNNVTEFSPAKINLFLAVTGRRPDGYHDLVSVVALLDFGDELTALVKPAGFTLSCDNPELPLDGSNLVLKAAQAFAEATGWQGGADFKLAKRIPLGAGLGGGSSNAVAALRALIRISGVPLAEAKLSEVALSLGSDCALFLKKAPVIMRGRGERVEALPDTSRLRGRRVLLFKPGFAISTAWAYGRMAARKTDYLPTDQAEQKLAAWGQSEAPAEQLLFNNIEGAVFGKVIALPVLLGQLQSRFGVNGRMSGSGSACFALLGDDFVTAPLVARIRECWGPAAFVQEARLT